MNDDEVLIFGYSRREALADRVLVDVTAAAKREGIRYPVAMTAAAFAECVSTSARVSRQPEQGWLDDVLWMLARTARRAAKGASILEFEVRAWTDERGPRPVRVRAVCAPGDDLSPCITVMLPDED